MIALYIGNHGSNVHTQDLLEYVHDGLLEIGETPRFLFDNFISDGINIALEAFDQPLTDSIIAYQKQHQGSKLFIMVTESLSETSFNSANVLQKSTEQATNHYNNLAYWETRYQCFTQLLGVTSGLVAFSQSLYNEYTKANFGVPVFYLPMAALPSYIPIRPVSGDKKDIDIYFSGSITEYRSNVLNQLKSFGLTVFNGSPHMPEYLRRHMLGRSKLAIGLKLDESTNILSKSRAHYYLTRQCPHLFEATPDITDLHPYLSFSTHSDIVMASRSLIASGCTFDNDKFEKFKSTLPYGEIFLSLNEFFKNCPVRR